MTSAKHLNFFGLTIALLSTRGSSASKAIIKLPKKFELPKSKPGNFVVCPLSIDTLIALTLTGARGNTAKEIANALLLPHQRDRIQQAFQELNDIFKENKNYNLSSTNKIYLQVGSKINEEFKDIASTSFNADIKNIDFQNKDLTVFEINKWVAEKTNNKITKAVKIDFMKENIRMAIINTIYYNGQPVKEFSRATSGKRHFFINKSDYVDVNMLESIGFFNFNQNSKLQAKILEIPYVGNDIAATLILPNDRIGLANLETRIDELFLDPNYTREPVHVRLPKFKITTAVSFTGILQRLGVIDAFQDSANFSGILQSEEPLKISTILHKSFIDGEEVKKSSIIGTRLLEITTNPSSLNSPHKFYADHPFMFYLKHKISGVFFLGRMYRMDGIIKNISLTSDIDKYKLGLVKV